MNDWQIWLETGLMHILDVGGYDHIMFIALMVFTYPINEWQKLLGLITAFTLGHTVALFLSVSRIVEFPQRYTEILIILTIIVTAINQLLARKNTPNRVSTVYLIICFFGIIHGLGFSYLLKVMLGGNENVISELLMFNVGLELGQIVVVVLVVLVLFLIGKYAKAIERPFRIGVISIILVISIVLCFTRILNLAPQ